MNPPRPSAIPRRTDPQPQSTPSPVADLLRRKTGQVKIPITKTPNKKGTATP